MINREHPDSYDATALAVAFFYISLNIIINKTLDNIDKQPYTGALDIGPNVSYNETREHFSIFPPAPRFYQEGVGLLGKAF